MAWKLGMTMTSDNMLLFNPLDLKEEELVNFIKEKDFHIYLICKRKKLHFERCDTSSTETNTSFFYYLNDTHDKEFVHANHSKEIEILSHKDGFMSLKVNDEIHEDNDYNVVNYLFRLEDDIIGDSIKEPMPSDLEIIYVGQSFGRSGKRHINKRLTNHEKIQEISSKIIRNSTNEEVLIIGLNYNVSDIGTARVTIDVKREDFSVDNLLKLREKARERMRASQEVTLYEAALISFFQPCLNKEYREKFPSLGYSSYEDIYSLDFDYSTAEINSKSIMTRVFSEHKNERKYIHMNQFALDTEGQKKEFFEFLFE